MGRDNREEHPKQGTAGAKAWAWLEGHGEMGQGSFPVMPVLGVSADRKTLSKYSMPALQPRALISAHW